MKKIIHSVSILLVLFVNILVVLISSLFYITIGSNNELINSIIENHNSNIVVDFNVDTNCPKENNIISNAYYQGTIQGCNCPNVLKRGSCNSERDKLCTDVYRTSNVELNLWKNNVICTIREVRAFHNYVNYKQLWEHAVAEGKECEKGFKPCSLLDDTRNVLCVDIFSSCPISSVSFTNNKDLITQIDKDNERVKDTKYISLNNESYLIFSNKESYTSSIPVEFKLFEEEPCAYSNEYHRNKLGLYNLDYRREYVFKTHCSNMYSQSYHLLKVPESQNSLQNNNVMALENLNNTNEVNEIKEVYQGYKYDERYLLLDSMNKEQFYNTNMIYNLVSKLPHYPFYNLNKIQMNLYTRTYMGISKNCPINFSPEDLEKLLLKQLNTHINIILLVVMSVVFIIFTFIMLCCNDSIAKLIVFVFIDAGLGYVLQYIIQNYLRLNLDKKIYLCVHAILAETLGIIEENYNYFEDNYLNKIYYIIFAYYVVLLFYFILSIIVMNKSNEKVENTITKGNLEILSKKTYKEDKENNERNNSLNLVSDLKEKLIDK